uniref:Ubiquitin associated protein 2-like n=1 Tax=Neogobius melanostomus TaxID=47308 RepID=A0A8C6SDJ7_9GOBI
MMTSMGGNRARGSWEQTQGQTQSQTQHKQRPQATAEQIRLAQMISDHNDADFEEKVKQLIDITGKDQDESMIALHDCNGDVNRAINVLLEGSPDTDSWEMVGKKKGVSGQKESSQAETGEEGKENREKGGERDSARRRGGAPRKGRGGTSRGRECESGHNRVNCKSIQIFSRTFNPADYAEPTQTDENYGGGSTWNNTGNMEMEEGSSILPWPDCPEWFLYLTGAWRTPTEEWGTEDWNEDLSETKIFTASSVASMPLPQESVTITKGQRIDLAVLLGKTPASSSSETENPPMETPQPPSLSQSLVFSNSKQVGPLSQTSSTAPYSQHSMVSMLSKGFGDVGDPKGGSTGTTGSQFLEQYKTAQALAQLAAQHSQTGPSNTSPSSWDTNTSLGQYDMKSQESSVHSPFTKRQPYQTATATSSMLDIAAVPSLGQQVSPSSSDAQGSSPLPLQQHKIKQQKKKAAITTKIPAMAVEMPGSADISGLNLQFGALQFGSEPVLPEYESTPAVTTPANQVQNSLYTSPNRSEQGFTCESNAALSNSNQMDMYDQRPPQSRRYPPSVSSSPQKDMQPKVGSNRAFFQSAAGSAVKSTPDSVVPVSVSNMGTLTDNGSGQASMLTSSNQTSLSALGHSDDMPPRKAPPNLPPGVPPLLPNPYIMAPGLLHAYPPQVYGYDDLQMLQTRIPLDYYSIPFPTPTTALTGREGSLTNNPYSGDLSKFGRGDASSPAPATTLAQTQQNQTQTHHTTQQPFLNPGLPPGYSYTSLPYAYTGMPGLPNTFQYGPVFPVAPTSSKQHGVNVGVNASGTPFQQASGYGSHGYSTGEELIINRLLQMFSGETFLNFKNTVYYGLSLNMR